MCAPYVNEWMLLSEPKRWDKSYLLGSSIAYVWISAALLALLFSSYDEKYDEREKYWRVFSENIRCSHSIIAPQHMRGIHNHRAAKIHRCTHTVSFRRLIALLLRLSFSLLPSIRLNQRIFVCIFIRFFFLLHFFFFFYLSILREFIFPPRIFNGCHAV